MRVSLFGYHQIMSYRMCTDWNDTLMKGAYAEVVD